MKTANIETIEVQESGELLICLEEKGNPSYQYIYREAKGVYWNSERNGFESRNAEKMSYEWWFDHIRTLVGETIGLDLQVTNNTNWLNVPESTKENLV